MLVATTGDAGDGAGWLSAELVAAKLAWQWASTTIVVEQQVVGGEE